MDQRKDECNQNIKEICRILFDKGYNYHIEKVHTRTEVIKVFNSTYTRSFYLHVKTCYDGLRTWPISYSTYDYIDDDYFYLLYDKRNNDYYIMPSLDVSIIVENQHNKDYPDTHINTDLRKHFFNCNLTDGSGDI